MRPVRPSSRQHPQSVYHPASQSHCPSIPRQSVRHPRPSVTRTVHPPSRHSIHDLSVHHPTTSVRLSYVTPSARHTNQSVRPSATVPTSVRHPHPSVRPSATVTPSVRHTNQYVSLSVTSRLSDCPYNSSALRPSFPTIHHTHDSNHSLAVVNGEQDSHHSLAVVNGEPSHTIHSTQDSSQSLAVVNGGNPARPRYSIGPLLTTITEKYP